MKQGMSLQELLAEVVRRSEEKHDYLVPTDNLTMETSKVGDRVMPVLQMRDNADHILTTDINDVAHRQIGTALSIPATYYDRMRMEQPELLTRNVNTWLESMGSRRMIRTLDGTARAFLSDRYRIIDNDKILETVLPEILDIDGMRVASCSITDERLYLKVINEKMTADVSVGDTVQSGMIISNSEVGMGSVTVQSLVYRLVCTNGMTVNDAKTRKNHIGRGNQAGEHYELYTDETLLADDKAFLLKLRDTVRAVSNEVSFQRVVDMMREAKNAKLQTSNIAGFVDLTAKEFALGKEESNGVLRRLIEGGDLSLYGLANAVTRHSQDVESYDRASALEAVGYSILSMPKNTWSKLNKLAA